MGTIGAIISRSAHSSRSSRLVSGLRTFVRMMEKQRTRMALMELTDEQLKDIGLSRSQVHREVSRRFWE